MLLTFERLAADRGAPIALRYYAACIVLMVFVSFRFADTKNIREVSVEMATIACPCLPTKNLTQPFYWDIPIAGFISNGDWFAVIFGVRARYHSCHGLPMNFLFVHTLD